MAAPKRKSVEEREAALEKTARLNLFGYSQSEIAQRLGVHPTQVQYDLGVIRKRYIEQTIEERKGLIEEKKAQYRAIMREAYEEWQRSKKETITETDEEVFITVGPGGGPAGREVKKIVRQQRLGDPAYLVVILQCLKAERELEALDAPKKFQGSVNVINWDALAQEVMQAGPKAHLVEDALSQVLQETTGAPLGIIEHKPIPPTGNGSNGDTHAGR